MVGMMFRRRLTADKRLRYASPKLAIAELLLSAIRYVPLRGNFKIGYIIN